MGRGRVVNDPFDHPRFARCPLISIARGIPAAHLAPALPVLAGAGIATIEVTMDTPGAAVAIAAVRDAAGDALAVGAGTVTDPERLELALAAGAAFVVTPNVDEAVIAGCRARGVPAVVGALSPSEVHRAHRLGARLVKLFPADAMGPGYLRALRAPYPDIPLAPTGGVTPHTIPAWRAVGAAAYGVGSPLLDRGRLAAGDLDWLKARARAFAAALG